VVNTNPFGELEATVRQTPSAAQRLAEKSAPASPPSGPRSGPIVSAPDTGRIPEDARQSWEETVARDVLVGKQLDGYVVKRRIGDGGMGIVYEGEHPIIGRKVAIKILRPEITAGVQARDLIAEARAASAIRHRGIIDVFGFGTIPGIGQYLVMEFLEGTPLNKIISERAPMAELEVIALLDELLAALSAAHAAGVIHRDLKPGNIFVERDSSGTECLKVLDFGLAKRSEVPHGSTPQTHASMIVGTPEYIAPEQAIGEAVGPQTDLYAAGLIAFEMLTRRLPFEGGSAVAWVIQHVQKEPPPPSSFVDVHPALDALVLRLLAKEPSQRPASAEEARRELKRVLQQINQQSAKTTIRPASTSRDERTVIQAPPKAPVTGPRASPPPASASSRPRRSETATETELLTTPTEPAHPVPPDSRRGLMVAAAGVALVVLAGLGGWMMRNRGSAEDPSRATAQVSADEGSTDWEPPPPDPHAPKPGPEPVPVDAAPDHGEEATPDEGEESAQADTLSPDPQPEGGEKNRPEASRKAPKTGTLLLIMKGTGTVYVDGKRRGEVPPLNRVSLSEGTHELKILNPIAHPYITKIKVVGGETLEHRVTLKPLPDTVQKP
jgi:serine/threonine-protein kinase